MGLRFNRHPVSGFRYPGAFNKKIRLRIFWCQVPATFAMAPAARGCQVPGFFLSLAK